MTHSEFFQGVEFTHRDDEDMDIFKYQGGAIMRKLESGKFIYEATVDDHYSEYADVSIMLIGSLFETRIYYTHLDAVKC